ncbi:hypothetical protein JCM8115_005782 [Rhodotorula mucilaginosa]
MATVTETLSIVDSLYQSRETLLHHTFTPFVSLAHAPHSLVQLTSPRGPGCTVSIGPHAFLSTHIYLCDWNPSGAGTGPTPPPPPAAAPSPAPLSTSAITPSLVARLNEASQEDRKLAETLRKAANGQASADELAGLATFIEHLRRQEEAEAANPPLPAGGSGAPPSVVLDFAETRYPPAAAAAATPSLSRKAPAVDRRVVLPAHFVLTPLPPRNQNPMQPALFHDVLLSLFIFPSELTPPQSARGKQRLQAAPEADLNAPVPVDIVVEGCDQRMLDGLWRAARNGRPRDDQLERWARQMINSIPHRTHILHIPPSVAAAAAAAASDTALAAHADDPTTSAGMSRSASQTGLLGAGGGGGTPLAGTKRGASARESPAAASALASSSKRQRTAAAAASPAPSSGRPPPTKRGSRASAVRAGSASASTPGASSPAAGPSRALDGTSSGMISLDQSPAPSSPAASAAASSTGRGGPAKKSSKGKAKGKGKRGKKRSIFHVGSEDDEESEEEFVLTGGSRRRAAATIL